MTLSHIAESAATHDAIVDSPKQALPRILSLTASEDEQVSQRSLCDHNVASRVMLRGSVKVQCSYMSVSHHIAIVLQVKLSVGNYSLIVLQVSQSAILLCVCQPSQCNRK